jgi:hypothetical protein
MKFIIQVEQCLQVLEIFERREMLMLHEVQWVAGVVKQEVKMQLSAWIDVLVSYVTMVAELVYSLPTRGEMSFGLIVDFNAWLPTTAAVFQYELVAIPTAMLWSYTN